MSVFSLVFDEATKEAMHLTVVRWRRIYSGQAVARLKNCPLCQLYHGMLNPKISPFESCLNCPVGCYTNKIYCLGTSHSSFDTHWKRKHHKYGYDAPIQIKCLTCYDWAKKWYEEAAVIERWYLWRWEKHHNNAPTTGRIISVKLSHLGKAAKKIKTGRLVGVDSEGNIKEV